MRLRPVVETDWELLLGWRNDPITVANSIQQRKVQTEEHKAWLVQKLSDTGSIMYIGEVGGVPVGQVRFDLGVGYAEVSVVVAPEVRGSGFGTELLKQGCSTAGIRKYIAYIRPENEVSIKAFETTGFFWSGRTFVEGVALERMELPPFKTED